MFENDENCDLGGFIRMTSFWNSSFRGKEEDQQSIGVCGWKQKTTE